MRSVLEGAKWSIALQVFSRGLTFLVNLSHLRILPTSLVSICALQLQLIQSTAQFISKETFRRACLKDENDAQAWILSLWSLPFAWVSSVLVPLLFWYSASAEELAVEGYGHFLALLGLASVIELSAEPLFIAAQREMGYRLRVGIEAVAVTLRSITTLLLVSYLQNTSYLVASFGIAQVIYS